jgi:tRNA(Glu) U13 pseudouridine synthase TruD
LAAKWNSGVAFPQPTILCWRIGLEWQYAGIDPVHVPGTSDLVLRNVNSGALSINHRSHEQHHFAEYSRVNYSFLDKRIKNDAAAIAASRVGSLAVRRGDAKPSERLIIEREHARRVNPNRAHAHTKSEWRGAGRRPAYPLRSESGRSAARSAAKSVLIRSPRPTARTVAAGS